MSERKVRVGIVGMNDISSMHEAGYAEIDDLCTLVAFCDSDEELARARAEPYQARVYTSYQDLLADPEIDLVDITAPHDLHYSIALAALEAGKHTLVEKPMALTSEEALRLIETAQRMHVRFTVAESTHFVAAYRETERLILEETLGEIRFVRASISGNEAGHSSDKASEEAEPANSEQLLDADGHIFYLLKWLFGGITDIQAVAYKLIPENPVDDHALVMGHLANGAVFTIIQNCASEAPWSECLEVHGSLGSLIVDQFANPPAIYFHSSTDMVGTPLVEVPFEPLAWKYLAILAGVQDFVHAVLDERPPLIDPLDGYHALQVVEAAHRSMSEETTIDLQQMSGEHYSTPLS